MARTPAAATQQPWQQQGEESVLHEQLRTISKRVCCSSSSPRLIFWTERSEQSNLKFQEGPQKRNLPTQNSVFFGSPAHLQEMHSSELVFFPFYARIYVRPTLRSDLVHSPKKNMVTQSTRTTGADAARAPKQLKR